MAEKSIVTLATGLRVGNFSSPHPFTFIEGTVLPAASDEDMNRGKLEVREVCVENRWSPTGEPYEDIDIEFLLTDSCSDLLSEWYDLYDAKEVDVVIVPLPVKTALVKADGVVHPPSMPERMLDLLDNNNRLRGPFRVIRMADRKTKTACATVFCV